MRAKFQYVGIRVRDLEKSIGFYSGLLGMQVVCRSKIHETKGEVASLESEKGGFNLELNHYDNDSPYNTRALKNIGQTKLKQYEFEIEIKSNKGKHQFRMDDKNECVTLLRQTYGEKVKY
jgi:catechol 2,3-dioxygenase-like lactoylglutathione lyase family enzyme